MKSDSYENNETYQNHKVTLVKDVIPKDDLKKLINIFMTDAGINMGNDFTDNTLERVIEIVDNNFRFLPICYVAGAFRKGSLGNYGAGRLVPRTINAWLNEITLDYNRDQEHERLTTDDNTDHFSDLVKYPLGQAICKKIDWYKSGAMNSDDWDKIPLKELAEMIGQGQMIQLETFGIKNKL